MSACFYKVNSQTLETVLFADNTALLFDAACKCKGNVNVIPDYSFRCVDVISILQFPSGVEVAYNIAGYFDKLLVKGSANDVMNILNTRLKKRPVFLGIRNLVCNEIYGCQYFYVYQSHYLKAITLRSILS